MSRILAPRARFLVLWLAGALSFCAATQAQDTQRQRQEQSNQQNQYRDQAQSTQQDQRHQDVQTYRGKVTQKYGKFFLEEWRTHSSYTLTGTWDEKRFLNQKVRVTGMLDTEKNILRVVSISLAP